MTLLLMSSSSYSADVNLSTTPLFLGGQAAPLVMLVMGRDHTLYYEAYNDATDLDGNGAIDEYETRYAPKSTSSYYGIFDSNLCYDYDFQENYFNPVAKANADKSCADSHWSGDFLNYLTTARIDAVRKVLYGGQRDIDTTTETRLRRTQLPHDAHSWGKVYTNAMKLATNTYPFDLSKYSPLPSITDDEQIFFANTSMSYSNNGNGNNSVNINDPLLRILILPKKNGSGSDIKIWNWLSKERPVADNYILDYDNITVNPGNSFASANSKQVKDIFVRVKSCVPISGYYSPECKSYSNSYKPEGLLQQYSNSMLFGLLTGSYSNNKQGGVVRKQISSLTDEIDSSTGQFNFNKIATTAPSVIRNINNFVVAKFNYTDRDYSGCGWITTRIMNNGECHDWGSPLAEMLYESVRYFTGVLQQGERMSV